MAEEEEKRSREFKLARVRVQDLVVFPAKTLMLPVSPEGPTPRRGQYKVRIEPERP